MKYLTTLKLPFYCMAITLTLLSTSCDKEEVLTPEQTLTGSWAGLVSQEGYDDFSLTVTLAEPIIDRVVGTGNYDGECTFNWTYLRKENEQFVFFEEILTGKQYCIDGTLRINVISENTLNAHWTGVDFDDNFAIGTLSRQ